MTLEKMESRKNKDEALMQILASIKFPSDELRDALFSLCDKSGSDIALSIILAMKNDIFSKTSKESLEIYINPPS